MTYSYQLGDKYEMLRDDAASRKHGRNLYTIKARHDVAFGVKAGDVGGLIEDRRNLSQLGSCWVYPGSIVIGSASVVDHASILPGCLIADRALVSDTAGVRDSLIMDDARVSANALVSKSVLAGNATVAASVVVKDSRLFGTCLPRALRPPLAMRNVCWGLSR